MLLAAYVAYLLQPPTKGLVQSGVLACLGVAALLVSFMTGVRRWQRYVKQTFRDVDDGRRSLAQAVQDLYDVGATHEADALLQRSEPAAPNLWD